MFLMRETLTINIRKTLTRKLLAGQIPVGGRIPTESELAKNFRVSLTTVRRAVEGLVHDGLLIRRQGSGTYVADGRRRRRQTIGLVIPETRFSPFYMQMAAAMEPCLRTDNYAAVLLVAEDIDAFHQALRNARSELDGLIVCGYLIHHDELRKEGIPYVLAGTETQADADCVCFDMKSGAATAVRHLIDLGHRRILFFSNHCPTRIVHPKQEDFGINMETDGRYLGYRQAMAQAGLETSPDWVFQAGPSRRSGYETMKQILTQRRIEFSAVFAGTDTIADGAAQTLREAGLGVPADVSLVGCDNLQDAADHVLGLTTIDLRIDQAARRAVELLIERIEHPRDDEFRCVGLVPKLIIRESTGLCRSTGR